MENSKNITVSAIAALGNQRQIGKNNKLLWNIPEDLERFKRLTNGKAVIMGRKTWESLPDSVRPLPNRENIILTRSTTYEASGGVVKYNPEAALEYARNWSQKHKKAEFFIIGGETIYRELLPQTQKLYLTLVDTDQEGDAFFPEYKDDFKVTKTKKGGNRKTSFTFLDLEKA